jgi:hypothetical protein
MQPEMAFFERREGFWVRFVGIGGFVLQCSDEAT